MNAPPWARSADTFYHEEGVAATLSANLLRIHLPQFVGPDQSLRVVGALWEVWIESRYRVLASNIHCVVVVASFNDLTLPIVTMLATIDSDLGRAGRHLRIIELAAAFSVADAKPRSELGDGRFEQRAYPQGTHTESAPDGSDMSSAKDADGRPLSDRNGKMVMVTGPQMDEIEKGNGKRVLAKGDLSEDKASLEATKATMVP